MPRCRPIAALALLAALLAGGCNGGPGVEAIGADGETADDPATGSQDEIALETPLSSSPRTTIAMPDPALEPELPATVAVVGDSLTESAADEIETTLTQNGVEVLALDGLTNRRMVRSASGVVPGTDAVDAILDTIGAADGEPPDMWVIALGTNDVGGAATPEEFAVDMRELLDRLPADAPVVWVDVWIRDRSEQVTVANDVIREVIDERGDGLVADWYSRGAEGSAIASDGVHLTDDGQWIFARTIIDAMLALAGERAR